MATGTRACRNRIGRRCRYTSRVPRLYLSVGAYDIGVRMVQEGLPTAIFVASDLMAFYFRSSEANDDCYNAMINREVCRPIAITTRKPAPLG